MNVVKRNRISSYEKSWTKTWTLDDIPKIVLNARFFEKLSFVKRVQIASGAVSRKKTSSFQYIPNGVITPSISLNKGKIYTFFIQSNPQSKKYSFDSFLFAIETDISPISLTPLFHVIEDIVKLMYGKYASDGFFIKYHNRTRSNENPFFVKNQVIYKTFRPYKLESKEKVPPQNLLLHYDDQTKQIK